MLHILLLSLAAQATADYDCICNYNPDWPVYDRPAASADSDTLGYLYEFDCKEKLPALTNTAFIAIAFEHTVGYIKANNDVQSQVCPGDPDSGDVLTSTQMAPSTTAIPTSAATTTTATATTKSSRIATSTGSVPSTSGPAMTTTTTKRPPSTTLKQPKTTQVPTVQTSKPVVQGQTSLCPRSLRDTAGKYGYSIGQFNRTCYLLRTYKTGWSSAENYCRSHGGYLFDVSNIEEQNYIMSFLASHHFKDEVWMGLQDRYNEENFRWISGEQLTYTNWYPYRKDDIDGHTVEDCAVLIPFPPFNGQWDDVHCGTYRNQDTEGHSHSSICQIDIHSYSDSHSGHHHSSFHEFIG